jgi:hypothetical protein
MNVRQEIHASTRRLGRRTGATKVLVGGLPAGFPGTVFIVLHTGAQSPGLLPEILAKYAASADRISALLIRLAHEPSSGIQPPVPENIKIQTEFATMNGDISQMNKLGQPSAYTCPPAAGPYGK